MNKEEVRIVLKRIWENDYKDDCDGHHYFQNDIQNIENYISCLEIENERMSKMINHSIHINDYKRVKDRNDKALNYIVRRFEETKDLEDAIDDDLEEVERILRGE